MELRIKKIMSDKGVTSAWISEKIGISKVAVSNIITGKSSPSLYTAIKIADALEVPITELFSSNSNDKLTALIQYKGEFYKANTIPELEKIVEKIKEKEIS